MDHRQQEILLHRFQLKLTPTISHSPHACPTPRKCAPSLLNSPSTAPLPFQGFNNRPDGKSQSSCSCSLAPLGNQFPTILSPREISHGTNNPPLQYPMGLTTHFFIQAPKITNYNNKYGYGYGFRYNDMKV
jgi:hypothetical protein